MYRVFGTWVFLSTLNSVTVIVNPIPMLVPSSYFIPYRLCFNDKLIRLILEHKTFNGKK